MARNKLKNKNHMIISVDVEKSLDNIKQPFMIKKNKKKTLKTVGIEATYFNIIRPYIINLWLTSHSAVKS